MSQDNLLQKLGNKIQIKTVGDLKVNAQSEELNIENMPSIFANENIQVEQIYDNQAINQTDKKDEPIQSEIIQNEIVNYEKNINFNGFIDIPQTTSGIVTEQQKQKLYKNGLTDIIDIPETISGIVTEQHKRNLPQSFFEEPSINQRETNFQNYKFYFDSKLEASQKIQEEEVLILQSRQNQQNQQKNYYTYNQQEEELKNNLTVNNNQNLNVDFNNLLLTSNTTNTKETDITQLFNSIYPIDPQNENSQKQITNSDKKFSKQSNNNSSQKKNQVKSYKSLLETNNQQNNLGKHNLRYSVQSSTMSLSSSPLYHSFQNNKYKYKILEQIINKLQNNYKKYGFDKEYFYVLQFVLQKYIVIDLLETKKKLSVEHIILVSTSFKDELANIYDKSWKSFNEYQQLLNDNLAVVQQKYQMFWNKVPVKKALNFLQKDERQEFDVMKTGYRYIIYYGIEILSNALNQQNGRKFENQQQIILKEQNLIRLEFIIAMFINGIFETNLVKNIHIGNFCNDLKQLEFDSITEQFNKIYMAQCKSPKKQ